MPAAVIIRMAAIFVVSFLAYKFLDILFDMAKSYFKGQSSGGEKKDLDTIDTKFVEKDEEDDNK